MSQELEQLREENETLRRENAHLQRVNGEQQATIVLHQEQLEVLTEQMALFKKAFFSPRRERFIPDPDQKLLFQPEPLDDVSTPEDADTTEPPARKKRRPKRKRFEFPQCLPVKRFEHPLAEEELACPCGCGERVVISEEITKQLVYIPPSAYVAEHVRYTYGCPKTRDGASVTTSDKPENINEKGI